MHFNLQPMDVVERGRGKSRGLFCEGDRWIFMGQEGLQKVEYGAAGSQKKRAEKELVGAVLATGGGI